MKKWAIGILVFVACLTICGFIAWSGGYDFDKRSPDVAMALMMAIWASAFAAVMAVDMYGETI